MNHLDVFLNTEIQDVNPLLTIADFFLGPVRFFFSGKTVKPARDIETGALKPNGNMAKVTSFFVLGKAEFEAAYDKPSKQDPNLYSTPWGYGVDILLFPIIMLGLLAPFTVIGSIFKAFSYLDSNVRAMHHQVKARLTPVDQTLEYNPQTIEEALNDLLMSGQKVNSLVIKANETPVQPMSPACLKLIKKLNPAKVVLVGDWDQKNFPIKAHLFDGTTRPREKKHRWNLSALNAAPQMSSEFDSGTANAIRYQARNKVDSVDKALNGPQSCGFFRAKHTVYVVNETQPMNKL